MMKSDSPERGELARAAQALRRSAGSAFGRRAPALALFCDDDRLPDPLAAARRLAAVPGLPAGAMVVARSRDPERLRDLATALCRLTLPKTLPKTFTVLVAGDMALARSLQCGLHLPGARIGEIARWRVLSAAPVTVAAHSVSAVWRARALGADAVFLSPVFPTRSHPGAAALGVPRANRIARSAGMPVYALGGVTAQTARRLSGFCGLAAIGALA